MITLGSTVKDKITGLEGIAESYNVHRNGCVRVSVQARINSEGKVPDSVWIDVDDLIIVGEAVSTRLLLKVPNEQDPGGSGRSVPPSFR